MSDDTTLDYNATTPDTNGATDDTKSGAFVPSHRLKEESDKRRAIEQEAERLREQLASKDKEVQLAEARGRYGEDIVNNEKVQELMGQHPTLTFDQVVTLAGIKTNATGGEAKTVEPASQGGAALLGRAPNPEAPKPLSIAEERAALERQLMEGTLTL